LIFIKRNTGIIFSKFILVPKILWFKEDGSEIKANEKYGISYNLESAEAELIIESVDPSDEMSYKCIASNKHGTAKTIGVLVVKGTLKNYKTFNLNFEYT
jgi:hypothetical protein